MKKKFSYFYNKEPIEFIRDFDKGFSGNFKSRSSYLNNLENVDLKIKKDEVVIDFKTVNKKTKKHISWDSKTFNNVRLFTPKYDLTIEKLYSWGWFTGFTNSINSMSFSKKDKKYFKFIIPLESDINFSFQFEKFFFQNDYANWSSMGTSILIDDEDFFILQEDLKVNNKKYFYLIIESNKKQLYEEFIDKVFSIRVALGYIIGDFRGGRAYVFSYNNKKRDKFTGFLFQSLRKDMKSIYQPINSNPYAWLYSKNRKQVDKIYNKKELRTLTKDEFSSLCKMCLSNDNFLGILLLMIESGTNSLLISPIIYFAALEQLGNIVSKQKPVFPIHNKNDAGLLIEKLLNIVEEFESTTIEKKYDLSPIKRRVHNINQETNSDKLVLCFEKLKIELLKDDLTIIKARNSLMHGNYPNIRKKKNRTIKDKDLDMYYISIRIYTLLNMLILKYIGYDNYVINFSKIYEKNTGYFVNEDFYRKV